MKAASLKLGIRVFGTLVGSMGISGLFFALGLFLPHAISSGEVVGVVLAAITFTISVYESYIGYLIWFRWSPLAVQHVCGVLIFLVWTLAAKYVVHRPAAGAPDWTMGLPMIGLVVLSACYRWLTAYMCKRLFPLGVEVVENLSPIAPCPRS